MGACEVKVFSFKLLFVLNTAQAYVLCVPEVLTLQREEVRKRKLLGLGALPVGEHGLAEGTSI